MSSEFRELLLGCGHARDKRIHAPGTLPEFKNLFTLDCNQSVRPDFLCNIDVPDGKWHVKANVSAIASTEVGRYFELLQNLYPTMGGAQHYVFKDETFDEIHAYEVLEHLGQQGDAIRFFSLFAELWRILKPNGMLFATVPSRFSPWLWGDPSHRRAILPESLIFLDQSEYIRQLDGEVKTPMSDFRYLYSADFQPVSMQDDQHTFAFVLRAIKPSRIGINHAANE